jgi:hypothetical protein
LSPTLRVSLRIICISNLLGKTLRSFLSFCARLD